MKLQHEVKLRQMIGPLPELTLGDAVADQTVLGFEIIDVSFGGIGKFCISRALL